MALYRIFGIASVFVIFAGPLCAQSGQISGSVTDEEGRPLAGALISLENRQVKTHYEVKTNSKGLYHRPLPMGLYYVSVAHNGKTIGVDVRVMFGGEHAVDFDFRPLSVDPAQRHTVNIGALTVPPKARREFQKALEAKDNLEKARKHLEKAIEIAPEYEQALNNLGTVYHRQNNFVRAAELFQRSLAVNPEAFEARVNLGGTLLALGQFDRALAENRRATEMRPLDGLAQGQMGLSLFYLKRYDEAIAYLKRAKEIDARSQLLPGFFLASAYDAAGDPAAALTEYEEFLNSNPSQPTRIQTETRIRAVREKPIVR
jgi:Flp pilus assembly protein TadD